MKGNYCTFIVRIHDEPGGNFRGTIQLIRTQEEAHFDSFQDMQAFMQKHLANPAEPAVDDHGDSSKAG